MDPKPLILIVDDDVSNIKVLENIFRADYRVAARKSGEQVLTYFETLGFYSAGGEPASPGTQKDKPDQKSASNIPDLILLDIVMPGMDGYEVCARLKSNPNLVEIPIIFISGKVEPEDITRGFETGSVDYVTKPFNAAELKSRVRTHLSLKDARESLAAKNMLLEQKMQELEEKTEKLRQKDAQLLMMDRIAGIGTLAAGIAHEINTPLGFLKSSVTSLRKDCAKTVDALRRWEAKAPAEFTREGLAPYLAEIGFVDLMTRTESRFARIDRGIEKIGKIVNSLRSFSRIDREKEGTLDVNASIEDAIEILSSSEKPIHFEMDHRQNPHLECIPNEINQCLLHVLKNAVDAVPPGGTVAIQTSYDQEKQRLCIRISDNGPGMSDEVRRQAFLPFFTTKPVGSGTGVGLTIVEHIVLKHQGEIGLTSKEGEGTTVSICLPVTC